jgi:hypothetical protein
MGLVPLAEPGCETSWLSILLCEYRACVTNNTGRASPSLSEGTENSFRLLARAPRDLATSSISVASPQAQLDTVALLILIEDRNSICFVTSSLEYYATSSISIQSRKRRTQQCDSCHLCNGSGIVSVPPTRPSRSLHARSAYEHHDCCVATSQSISQVSPHSCLNSKSRIGLFD